MQHLVTITKEVTANHCAHWNWAAKEISRLSSEIMRNAITREIVVQ